MRVPTGRLIIASAIAALLVAPVAQPTVAVTRPAMPSDFNGDGFADLAIGTPNESVGSTKRAGAVNVLYGSQHGLTADGDQLWSQASPGVPGRPGRQDGFAWALAAADFDGDGFGDLAIGVPWDTLPGSDLLAGSVNLLYGSRSGLIARHSQRWSRANLPGEPAKFDAFGFALASGDFDADGFGDLAIGVPGRGLAGDTGVVQVLFGSSAGLAAARTVTLTNEMTGAPPVPALAAFGSVLAAGDLNSDGRAELAIGTPAHSDGRVGVFYGSADGLDIENGEPWTQSSPGLDDPVDWGDRFGGALAIGDFDRDGVGDLAVGTPNIEESAGALGMRGKVIILRGASDGLTTAGSQVWPSVVGGLDDTSSEYGSVLAAGDFDGDGDDDLAIGAPYAGFKRGAVVVMDGGAGGLDGVNAEVWSQASAGVPGTSENYDVFGASLASLDVDGSGIADLAIGIPGETMRRQTATGRVIVLRGRAPGLSATHVQSWSQDTPGVKETGELPDNFGASLGVAASD